MSKFNVGDKVRFLGTNSKYSSFYPSVGIIGVVNMVGKNSCRCEWPEEHPEQNGAGNYTWWVRNTEIELVEKEKEMTNEEVWKMLQPKLLKNYIFPNNVSEAVGMAYRVGYLRATKGRPFKFGEKKKGGHWERVDPNNLPKERTRVRYARECEDYKGHDDWIQLNDTGVIKMEGTLFGMDLDTPKGWMKWFCFDDDEDCLDMWMEDDE